MFTLLLVQFELNISLHSLINILSRLSRLFGAEMNGIIQGRKNAYITVKSHRYSSDIDL